jgi:hypothetical protein
LHAVAAEGAVELKALLHRTLLQAYYQPPNYQSLKLYLKKNLYLRAVNYPALHVIPMKQPTQQRQG